MRGWAISLFRWLANILHRGPETANLVHISCIVHKLIGGKNNPINSYFSHIVQHDWVLVSRNQSFEENLNFLSWFSLKPLSSWYVGQKSVFIMKTFRFISRNSASLSGDLFQNLIKCLHFHIFHFHFLNIFSSLRASKWFMTGVINISHHHSAETKLNIPELHFPE